MIHTPLFDTRVGSSPCPELAFLRQISAAEVELEDAEAPASSKQTLAFWQPLTSTYTLPSAASNGNTISLYSSIVTSY